MHTIRHARPWMPAKVTRHHRMEQPQVRMGQTVLQRTQHLRTAYHHQWGPRPQQDTRQHQAATRLLQQKPASTHHQHQAATHQHQVATHHQQKQGTLSREAMHQVVLASKAGTNSKVIEQTGKPKRYKGNEDKEYALNSFHPSPCFFCTLFLVIPFFIISFLFSKKRMGMTPM